MAAKKTSASKTSGKAKARATSKKHQPAAPATTAKKAVAKKAAVKKAVAKKAPVKRAAVKKAAVKKTVSKKAAPKKMVSKKAVAKKAPVKKVAVRKTAAPKAVIKKVATKKAAIKKTPVKKSASAKPASKITTSVRPAAVTVSKVKPVVSKARPRPSVKAAKGSVAKPVSSVRIPVRKATSPRRPARSAARGVAPAPASTVKEAKVRVLVDEPLSQQKLREAIRTAVLYLEAWLRSSGAEITPAVAELAAPAEASRAQVWRWLDMEARFSDDRPMTPELFEAFLNREMELLREDVGTEAYDIGLFVTASQLFLDLALAPDFEDFPGLPANRLLGIGSLFSVFPPSFAFTRPLPDGLLLFGPTSISPLLNLNAR